MGCIKDPADSFLGISNMLCSFVDEKQMKTYLNKDISIIFPEMETISSQKSRLVSILFFIFTFIY